MTEKTEIISADATAAASSAPATAPAAAPAAGQPAMAESHLKAKNRSQNIDFWRGAALVMIFINHIPGNPFGYFTLKMWGFADSAEIFVFMAGLMSAMVIGRAYETQGVIHGLLKSTQRAWILFRTHILLIFALSLIIALAGEYIDSTPIKERFNFYPLFFETDRAIIRVINLSYLPNMTDILPIYIIFTVAFPVIWMLRHTSWLVLFTISCALWMLANYYGFGPRNYPSEVIWHFNPLGWQFMFILGVLAPDLREPFMKLANDIRVESFAWLFLICSFIAVAPWTMWPPIGGWRLFPPEWLRFDDKTNLSAVRVFHFLCLLLVAARRSDSLLSVLPKSMVSCITVMGRQSLLVFTLGALLSLTVFVIGELSDISLLTYALLTPPGIGVLILAARYSEWSKKHLKPKPVTQPF